MAKDKIDVAEISEEDMREIIDELTNAIDDMIADFRFTLNVLDNISTLLKQSPADISMVKMILDQFFG